MPKWTGETLQKQCGRLVLEIFTHKNVLGLGVAVPPQRESGNIVNVG